MQEHPFTATILEVLTNRFGDNAPIILNNSQLLQYINIKTKSASSGSKSRSSFGNLYAIYVLLEDYIKSNFDSSGNYEHYDGARFSDLFRRQRELPFGSKLQNHALNHRMNEEFRKYFPTCEFIPILRDATSNRYWFNENLLKTRSNQIEINIARAILEIIDKYVVAKKDAFESFIANCQMIQELKSTDPKTVEQFIRGLLQPNVDARIFEIVSFGILKEFYSDQIVYWGFSLETIQEENLTLYKTGRTNANDGGIDFVMRPIGRFFQVTETIDVKKYFLDIDKVQRYPITFVVKSDSSIESIRATIRVQALRSYGVSQIVERYMDSVEEIINIPELMERFLHVSSEERVVPVIDEIVLQSKVEFNYNEVTTTGETETEQ